MPGEADTEEPEDSALLSPLPALLADYLLC